MKCGSLWRTLSAPAKATRLQGGDCADNTPNSSCLLTPDTSPGAQLEHPSILQRGVCHQSIRHIVVRTACSDTMLSTILSLIAALFAGAIYLYFKVLAKRKELDGLVCRPRQEELDMLHADPRENSPSRPCPTSCLATCHLQGNCSDCFPPAFMGTLGPPISAKSTTWAMFSTSIGGLLAQGSCLSRILR